MEQGHQIVGIGLGGPDCKADLSTTDGRDLAKYAMMNYASDAACLINNAGTTFIEKFENLYYKDLEKVFSVNFAAAFELTKYFMHARKASAHKDESDIYRVICTTSMATVSASRGSLAYVCSKAALEAMIATLSREWAGKKPFMIMGVAPAWVFNTAIGSKVIDDYAKISGLTPEQNMQYARSYSPMGRSCTMEEVWPLYDFAVNKAPIWMSGEIIRMPGGSGTIG
jgi:NAD(P)-dependent dehydrogenase (short-subunit alcohol dehydrogenase family)